MLRDFEMNSLSLEGWTSKNDAHVQDHKETMEHLSKMLAVVGATVKVDTVGLLSLSQRQQLHQPESKNDPRRSPLCRLCMTSCHPRRNRLHRPHLRHPMAKMKSCSL